MLKNHMPSGCLLKRVMDFLVAISGLILLLPVWLLIALLVRWTSPGPAFFRQKRLGLRGVPFDIIKFRTMIDDAPDTRNPDGSTFNAITDPRVTPVGRFLRRTSLDETPQLLNVMYGEMSLVGPRPDPIDAILHYRRQDFLRLTVKPGMTGWAAVHGRNSISWEQRRDLDLEYVEIGSFSVDLEILLRTIPTMMTGKGVYRSTNGHA